jgi:hypothetical protein
MTKRAPKHHELPRFYLSGFAEPGTSFVWVYERGLPYKPGSKYVNNPRRTGLNHAGLRHDGYAARDREGRQHFDFEIEFQKREHLADDAIRRVRQFQTLTVADKRVLSEYIALIWRRGGGQEQQIREMGERYLGDVPFDSVARHFADKGQFEDALQTLEAKAWYASNDGKIEWLRESILSHFSRVVTIFSGLRWSLLRSPENAYFVSSDTPVVYDRGRGIRVSPVRFPFSSDVLLLASWERGEDLAWIQATEAQVTAANDEIIASAVRHVYARRCDEWILRTSGSGRSDT